MSETVLHVLDLLVVALIATSVVVGTQWLHSRVGGWRRLALRYPRRLLWPERRVLAGHVAMGRSFRASYRANVLRVIVGPEGVGLEAATRTARLFHPPLLLPWHAITGCTRRALRWAPPETVLTLADPPLTIRVRGAAADALQQAWTQYSSAPAVASDGGARSAAV